MTFTTDPTTDIGLVRLLITDRDPVNPIFPDDADITAFLNVEGGITKRAAALALETIAVDQVLVLKVIKNLQLSTDGAKVSDALLKRAGLLRTQAAEADDDLVPFEIAEWAVNDFAAREIVRNIRIRAIE